MLGKQFVSERIAVTEDDGQAANAVSASAVLGPPQPRQGTRARVVERMVHDYADRARYVMADDWSHYFSDDVPEFDTRWVFDRRRWELAILHVKRRSSAIWLMALPDEIQDLEDSLTDATPNALDREMEDFGVVEIEELPEWIGNAREVVRETFVGPFPTDR